MRAETRTDQQCEACGGTGEGLELRRIGERPGPTEADEADEADEALALAYEFGDDGYGRDDGYTDGSLRGLRTRAECAETIERRRVSAGLTDLDRGRELAKDAPQEVLGDFWRALADAIADALFAAADRATSSARILDLERRQRVIAQVLTYALVGVVVGAIALVYYR